MFVSTSLLTRECNAGSPCDAQFSNHKHNSTVLYSVCSTNGLSDRVTNSTGAWLMQSWSDSRSTFSPRPVQDCQRPAARYVLPPSRDRPFPSFYVYLLYTLSSHLWFYLSTLSERDRELTINLLVCPCLIYWWPFTMYIWDLLAEQTH